MNPSRLLLAAFACGAFTATAIPTAAANDRPKRATVAERKAFKEALSAGRKAVKAKDYKAGIAQLEAALKIVPTSASVLGELGWAYFLDGQLDKASDRTSEARHAANRPAQLGAILYNAGRIQEAQGRPELARYEYTESLGYRDNAVVRKRVDALGGPIVTARMAEGSADFEAAIAVAGSIYCSAPHPKPATGDGDGCLYETLSTHALKGGLDEARIVLLTGYADDVGGSLDTRVLVVRKDTKWYGMGVVADGYVPGVAYITNNGEINAIEVKDVLPGLPGEELIIRATNSSIDHDPGVEETSSDEQKTVWICGLSGGAPTCTYVTEAVEWSTNQLTGDWEAGKKLDGDKWSTDVVVADGKITITSSAKTLPPAVQACVGSLTFEVLTGKVCATTIVGK